MSRLEIPLPANDEQRMPQIRVKRLNSPPLLVAEVEIFDALISNIEALTAVNDNQSPTQEENTP